MKLVAGGDSYTGLMWWREQAAAQTLTWWRAWPQPTQVLRSPCRGNARVAWACRRTGPPSACALGQQGFREGPELHSAVLAARHQGTCLLQPAAGFREETPAQPCSRAPWLRPARPQARTGSLPHGLELPRLPPAPLVTQSNSGTPSRVRFYPPTSRLLLRNRSPLGVPCPSLCSTPPELQTQEIGARAASASADTLALTATLTADCAHAVCVCPEP